MNIFLKIVAQKRLLLAVFIGITALSAWQSLDLSFHHQRNRFFPADNVDLAFAKDFFLQIEQDDIYILAGLELEESALATNQLKQIEDIGNQLEEIELVDNIMSVATFKQLKKGGPTFYAVPIGSGNPEFRTSDSLKILENPYIINNLISKDFKNVNIILKTQIINGQEMADAIYHDIKEVLDATGLEYHLGGYPIMQSITVNKLRDEMQFYVSLSTLLLIIILFIIYRSVWGLIVPIMCLIGGLSIFFAFLKISGQQLDLMGPLYPILMLIFLMADVVHLQTHYMDELSTGKAPLDAMRVTIKEIGIALFLTSFTTAVGFGALVTSRIEAIRYFGLNSAIGVLIAFLLVIVFASSALLFFTKGKLSNLKKRNDGWNARMLWLFNFNKRHKKAIGIFSILLIAGAFVGISQISTNAFIKGDLPEKAKLRLDFDYLEEHFGGIRALEMAIIPAEGKNLDNPEVLRAVAQLEDYLADTHGMSNIVAPTAAYKSLEHASSRGRSGFTLPKSDRTLKRYTAMLAMDTSARLKSVSNADGTLGRISARQKDRGSDFHEAQNLQIASWVKEHIDKDLVNFRVTGTTLMYDRNHEYLRKSLFRSLGLAFLIVGLMFAVLFRDYRMVLVSLIPNVIPLLLAAAMMGILGIKLQALTSIFFAISFGIAVDDTIHFLTRFKLERKKGKTVDKAIKNTLVISGKAIIITSLILVVSFCTLIFSEFKGTYYIGVLVSATLLSALLADLFVLPQLLYLINRSIVKDKRKQLQRNGNFKGVDKSL